MLNYELCLKLKEAGFPQGGKGSMNLTNPQSGCVHRRKATADERATLDPKGRYSDITVKLEGCECFSYEPTLSELIEACGERFESLNFHSHRSEDKWDAWGGDIVEAGKTPEEAVCNLFLALAKLN